MIKLLLFMFAIAIPLGIFLAILSELAEYLREHKKNRPQKDEEGQRKKDQRKIHK